MCVCVLAIFTSFFINLSHAGDVILRAIPFEILRGAEWKKNKNMWGGGPRKNLNMWGGVHEKIKICEGGSAKFSIRPRPSGSQME